MPGRVSYIAAIFCSCLLGGCYTPAGQYDFAKEEVVNKPKNVVWDKTIEYFAKNNIDIKAIDKTSYIIAGEKIGESNIVDCGAGNGEPILDKQDAQKPMLTFNVYLKAQGDQTLVGLHSSGGKSRAFRPMMGDTEVKCESKGVFETEMLKGIKSGAEGTAQKNQ